MWFHRNKPEQPHKLPNARRKRNNLTFRVRDQMRDRLVKAAAASQRSVSEEVEYRLNRDFEREERKSEFEQLRAKIAELERKIAIVERATQISIKELQRLMSAAQPSS